MPPRTRAAKSTKGLKENVGIAFKSKPKGVGKLTKTTRKVLGDKTNSASDDNTSVEVVKKAVRKPSSNAKNVEVEQDNVFTDRPRRTKQVPGREVVKVEAVKNPPLNVKSVKVDNENDSAERRRRDRKLPERFAGNQLLSNLSKKSNEHTPSESLQKSKQSLTPAQSTSNSILPSPFKTPQKPADNSLVANRPRRICRLPSKFEDHSISPNKFIPVKPFQASTPIIQKKSKTLVEEGTNDTRSKESEKSTKFTLPKSSPVKKVTEKDQTKKHHSSKNTKKVISEDIIGSKESSPVEKKTLNSQKGKNLNSNQLSSKEGKKASPDSNNNPKGRTLRARKVVDSKVKLSPIKESKAIKSPDKKTLQRPINKNFSFKILADNENNTSNQDIYEFTFDPNEEPPPQKKKRKAVKRKPAKPKTVVLKNNYERNISQSLASLKNAVAKKQGVNVDSTTQRNHPTEALKRTNVPEIVVTASNSNIPNIPQIQRNVASKIIIGNIAPSQQNKTDSSKTQQNAPIIPANNKSVVPYSRITNQSLIKLPEPNKSVRIEDIAADFEPSLHEDMNYSPVNTPRPRTPTAQNRVPQSLNQQDPLNLKDNASFFDEQPIASSSMNMSVRHPHASPWRVEFESLPIRWHVNSYVKPNMTPAVECSFVNFEDKNKKKHVYTNMVPQSDEPLPEITEKGAPNLVQTSIISFIREVVERNSAKKRQKSATPGTPYLFTDTTNKTPEKNQNKNTEKQSNKAARQLFTPKKSKAKEADNSKDTSSDKENSKESSKGQKRKNDEEISAGPAKTPRKEKDVTFFGFDESENFDLENISPKKNKKSLRPKARAVLKEINEQKPTRAAIPLAAKTRSMDVERLYKEMKSASDAPMFPQKEPVDVGTAVDLFNDDNEDSVSVHLYEDIELVHHSKPQRKSYGKAKKVTFINNDSDTQDSDPRPAVINSDSDEDLNDLTFNPAVPALDEKKPKKKFTKKQKMTKKEAEEAEAWAASFNSMCEDVEGFDLIVE